MNELASTSSMLPVPAPRVAAPLSFRLATMADIAALDALQKQYNNALGYFPTKQFEGYIKLRGILIAESAGVMAGYCISRDRYQKRDELGVIFQLCVVPGDQRKLVGAALVREVFARSAYGCRLYCCWCAQDLNANYFWQSMGFVPIAFRTGSRSKGAKQTPRVHIFWERRIREGDETTPWWFPSQTTSGAIREDRIVLPIPPQVHWKDVMPIVLPGSSEVEGPRLSAVEGPEAPGARASLPDASKKAKQKIIRKGSRAAGGDPLPQTAAAAARARFRPRVQFGPPPEGPEPVAPPVPEKPTKPKREPKPKVKSDPRHIAAARELRDRYLERVNADPSMLLPSGKYEVSRTLSSTPSAVEGSRALPDSSSEATATPALPSPLAA